MVEAKFADNTKLFRVVKTKTDCNVLQKNFFKLGEWSIKCSSAEISVKYFSYGTFGTVAGENYIRP